MLRLPRWCIFILAFTQPFSACAAAPVILNSPAELVFDQELIVDVSLDCTKCTTDTYLRAVFYPSGTNYFGYTQNEKGDWVNSTSDKSQFYNISQEQTKVSTWSGSLKAKLDLADSAYSGSGTYQFKLGRYTSSTDSSADWSEPKIITVIGPSPTSIPTSTPTSAPTSTTVPTFTPKPNPTSTPTSTPTLVPSKIPTKTPTPKIPTIEPTTILPSPAVLDATIIFTPTFTASEPAVKSDKNINHSLVSFLIIAGLGIIGVSVIWYTKHP